MYIDLHPSDMPPKSGGLPLEFILGCNQRGRTTKEVTVKAAFFFFPSNVPNWKLWTVREGTHFKIEQLKSHKLKMKKVTCFSLTSFIPTMDSVLFSHISLLG